MACISSLPIIAIYSHDSIMVGEDGPTHEPIEQLSALRNLPNNNLFRPGTIDEILSALKFATISTSTPVTIVTSRQKFDFVSSTNIANMLSFYR